MRTRIPQSIPPLLLIAALLTGCASSSKVAVPEGASPAEMFALAEQARGAGNLGGAEDLFELVYEDHPSAPEAKAAEWLAAECAYEQEDLKRARKRYQDYHDTHPLDRLGEIEERMYDIGVRLYEGGVSGLLGLGILPTTEDGILTLTWITESLPNGSRADDSFFYMGERRLEGHLFEEAALFFEELLTRYPESEWRYEALFQKGTAHLRENRGPAYDLDSLVAGRREFSAYVREVERDPGRRAEYADRLAEARANLAEIDARVAEKNLIIARFYLSLERESSAEPYLRASAEEYAGTDAGQEARRILEEIRGGE